MATRSAALMFLASLLWSFQPQPALARPAPAEIEVAANGVFQRRQRLAHALRDGVGVQYWGEGYEPGALASSPHGLLILEAATIGADESPTGREGFFTREDVARINHQGRRPVLGYLNVSEIETYRDYWVASRYAGSPDWIGPAGSADDEQVALYWKPSWRSLLEERVDRLMGLGLDGIFLDDVLHYYTYAAGEFSSLRTSQDWPDATSAYAVSMMELVKHLARRARQHRAGAFVVVNNGVFIGYDAEGQGAPFAEYLQAIDGILVEDVFAGASGEHVISTLKSEYQAHGVEVMTVDFASADPGCAPAKARHKLAAQSQQHGFTPYVADDPAFNRLYPPLTGVERLAQPG